MSPSFIHYNQLQLFNNKTRNLSEANGMKVQISDKRFSLNTIQDCLANLLVANFVQGCRRINFLIRNTQGSLTLGVQHYSLAMSSTSLAVLFSALPHC